MDSHDKQGGSTRERIVKSTLEIIGREGVQALSVRRITESMNINVSAIHYHFGTKENLIQESMGFFFSRIKTIYDTLTVIDRKPEERLKDFLRQYVDVFLEYPGVFISQVTMMIDSYLLSKGVTCEDPVHGNISDLSDLIKAESGWLKRVISEITGISDDTALSYKAVQLITSIVHPMFLTSIPSRVFCVDYRDQSIREDYLNSLVQDLVLYRNVRDNFNFQNNTL